MFIYQHPLDNIAGSGTLTASTTDASYPLANLYDRNPAKPFRHTANIGWLLWDFTNPQQVDFIALIHHNLANQLPVYIQGNSGNAWLNPPLSQQIEIPDADFDGFTVNAWKDLTSIQSRSYRFWRLIVSGANVANVAFGEVWLSKQRRTLPNDVDWPVLDEVNHPVIEHTTDYLVSTVYDLGTKQRSLRGSVKAAASGRAAIKNWWDACGGRSLPSVIVPFPEVNEALMVRWGEVVRADSRQFEQRTIDCTWIEVSRGLVL